MRADFAMSRDQVRHRKIAGYAAICAVGFNADPSVFRLATAENVEGHLALIQPGRWEALHFRRLVWTPGLAVARTIVAGVEHGLSELGWHLGQHWFRADLERLDVAIAAEAGALRSPIWSHDDLVRQLQHRVNREADRYAEGRF